MVRDLVVLLFALVTCAAGLEAKWTPNGEAPAPHSTKARQAMGMDPAAMAGMAGAAGAPVSPPGGALKFNLGCLLVVYLCNNWKIVLAIQELVLKLLRPTLAARDAKRDAAERQSAIKATATARKARLQRLRQSSSKSAGGGSADDD